MGVKDHGHLFIVLCLIGLSEQFGDRVSRLTRGSRRLSINYVLPQLDHLTKSSGIHLHIESFLDSWKKQVETNKDKVDSEGLYTVFAPVDAVFSTRLPLDISGLLLNDNTFQQMVVLNHIAKGKIRFEETGEVEIRTLGGHALLVERSKKDGKVRINGVHTLGQPVESSRFLLYTIDDLLNISSDNITDAVERILQSDGNNHVAKRSTTSPRREKINPPRGPPSPNIAHRVTGRPQPPAIPLNVRSPAPPIDGPQPPAWIPEDDDLPSGPPLKSFSSQPTKGKPQPPAIPLNIRSPAPPVDGPQPPAWIPDEEDLSKTKKKVIMLGSLTKKREVDENSFNALDSEAGDTDEYLNIGAIARQGPSQRLMLMELMSPLMLAPAKVISKMMKKDMSLAKALPTSREGKTMKSEPTKKTSQTPKNRNLATASIFSSLPIYQFLTGAVAARVDLRKGNLTLLAPSDVALHRLELSLPALIIRNRQSAIRLIRNHVIQGTVTIKEAVEAATIRSVEGNELIFEGEAGTFSVNGVPVSTPDVILNNGVIHVIDGVLIPDESTDLDFEQDSKNKNTDSVAADIETILQDFFPELEKHPEVTTHRPTSSSTMPTIEMNLDDENIEPLPPMLRANSFPNVFAMAEEELGAIEEFVPGMSIPQPTEESTFTKTTKKPKNKSKKVKTPTTRAPVEYDDYDEVHHESFAEDFGAVEAFVPRQNSGLVKDKVVSGTENDDLAEPLNEIDKFAETFQLADETIASVLERNGCNKMLSLLEKADLISKFESKGPYTVFAPDDSAFAKLPNARLEELTLRPMLLRRLLLFHIVTQENQEEKEVGNDVLFDTMEGSPIRFNIYDGEILVNGARVTVTDQEFKNGVVHVLEQIIFPPLGNVAVTMTDRDFGTKRFLEAFELEKANMLKGTAPLTVIAPLDTAFDELNITWSDFTANPKELSTVIRGHVIPGVLYSQACKREKSLFTTNGEMVKCLFKNGTLTFNGVEAIDKDITATNGVIHLIPTLLELPTTALLNTRGLERTTESAVFTPTIPVFEDAFFTPTTEDIKKIPDLGHESEDLVEEPVPEEVEYDTANITTEPEAETLPPVTIMRPGKTKPKKMPPTVATAVERHNLTIFSKFLEASGLRELVDQDGPWTVFAPTNNAFSMLPAAIVQQLSHDRLYLKRILSYHIVPGRLTRRHLANDAVFPTLSDGTEVRTNQYSDGKVMWYTVSGSRILDLDEMAGNGVLHVLENVLYPPHGDMLTTLNGSPILMQISMLVHDLAISNELQGDPITLFVPNDEAFQHLNMKTMKNQRRLRVWLRKHIVKGTHYSSGLIEGRSLEAVDGFSRINITESPHCINANGQEILYPDISVTNGVLHVTDGLMFTV